MANTTISTPVGPFSIIARGSAVLSAGFTDDLDELVASIHPTLRDDHDADADFDDIVSATYAYFDGDLIAIDTVKVDQHSGGQFLDHTWETLRRVPGGLPVTYKALGLRRVGPWRSEARPRHVPGTRWGSSCRVTASSAPTEASEATGGAST